MNQFRDDDDELGSEEFKSGAAKQTATTKTTTDTTPAPAATTTATAAAVADDDGFDLSSEEAKELKAKAVAQSHLPKEQNKRNRVAFIPKVKARVGNVHFIEGAGSNSKGMSVICPGEGCPECAKGHDHAPRRKIAVATIKYETTNEGKWPEGTKVPTVSAGYITLSPSAFTELSAAPSEEEGEDVYGVDFFVQKKSNNIGWNFTRAGKVAYVKTGLEAQVQELGEPYLDGKLLKSRLGKTVTVAELKALIRGRVEDTAASLADIEGLNID